MKFESILIFSLYFLVFLSVVIGSVFIYYSHQYSFSEQTISLYLHPNINYTHISCIGSLYINGEEFPHKRVLKNQTGEVIGHRTDKVWNKEIIDWYYNEGKGREGIVLK